MRTIGRLMATAWGGKVKKVDRSQLQPLVYPYTFTACLIQENWIFYYKQCWWPRYYLYANIICYPLWVWIHFKGE